jgi:ABC-type uncharacterized transport system fused permease/ATPase subunit
VCVVFGRSLCAPLRVDTFIHARHPAASPLPFPPRSSYLSFYSRYATAGFLGAVLSSRPSDVAAQVLGAAAAYAALGLALTCAAFLGEHLRLFLRARITHALHAVYFRRGVPYALATAGGTRVGCDADAEDDDGDGDGDASAAAAADGIPATSPLGSTPSLGTIDQRLTADVDSAAREGAALLFGSYLSPGGVVGSVASIVITFLAVFSPTLVVPGPDDDDDPSSSSSVALPSSFPVALPFAAAFALLSVLLSTVLALSVSRAYYAADAALGAMRYLHARVGAWAEEIALLRGGPAELRRALTSLAAYYARAARLTGWSWVRLSWSAFQAQYPYFLAYVVVLTLCTFEGPGRFLGSDDDAATVDPGALATAVSVVGQFIAALCGLTDVWASIAVMAGYVSRVSDALDVAGHLAAADGAGGGGGGAAAAARVAAGGDAPPVVVTLRALHESLTVTMRPGTIVWVQGASGCGKTTALRRLAGLDRSHVGGGGAGEESGDGAAPGLPLPSLDGLPAGTSAAFLPQRGYIPPGDLLDAVLHCAGLAAAGGGWEASLRRTAAAHGADSTARATLTAACTRLTVAEGPGMFSMGRRAVVNPTGAPSTPREGLESSSAAGEVDGDRWLRDAAAAALGAVGLGSLLEGTSADDADGGRARDWMAALSGGEQQRVLLAALLVRRVASAGAVVRGPTAAAASAPLFAFLDESTSALDAETELLCWDALLSPTLGGGMPASSLALLVVSHRSPPSHILPRVSAVLSFRAEGGQLGATDKEGSDATLPVRPDSVVWINRLPLPTMSSSSSSSSSSFASSSPSSPSALVTPWWQHLRLVVEAAAPTLAGLRTSLSSLVLLSPVRALIAAATFSPPPTLFSDDLVVVLLLFLSVALCASLTAISVQVAFFPGTLYEQILAGDTEGAWSTALTGSLVYLASCALGAGSRAVGELLSLSWFCRIVEHADRRYLAGGGEVDSGAAPPFYRLHHQGGGGGASGARSGVSGGGKGAQPPSKSAALDRIDQRLIADTASLTTSLGTLLFGGGSRLSLIQIVATIVATSVRATDFGPYPLLACLATALIALVGARLLARGVPQATMQVSLAEGLLRAAHSRVRTYAEEVGFLGCESAGERRGADACAAGILAASSARAAIEFPLRLWNSVFAYVGTASAFGVTAWVVAATGSLGPSAATATNILGCAYLLTTLNLYLLALPDALANASEAGGYVVRVGSLLEALEAASVRGQGGVALAGGSGGLGGLPINVGPVAAPDLRRRQPGDSVEGAGSTPPLHEPVSFALARGGLVSVRGPSGAGKTSLLRVLAGLLRPAATAATAAGWQQQQVVQLPSAVLRNDTRVIPQRVYCFAGTLADNVRYPSAATTLRHAAADGGGEEEEEESAAAADADRILRALDGAGLSLPALFAASSTAAPGEAASDANLRRLVLTRRRAWHRVLSGGERNRLAVARALYHEPAVVLADEPVAALPRKDGDGLIAALRRAGCAVVVVEHSE